MPDELADFEKRFAALCGKICDRLDGIIGRMDGLIARTDNLISRAQALSQTPALLCVRPQFKLREPPDLTWSQG